MAADGFDSTYSVNFSWPQLVSHWSVPIELMGCLRAALPNFDRAYSPMCANFIMMIWRTPTLTHLMVGKLAFSTTACTFSPFMAKMSGSNIWTNFG